MVLDNKPGASNDDVPGVPYGWKMDLQYPRETVGSPGGEGSSFYIPGDGHLQDAGLHPQRRTVRSATDNRVNL